MPSKGTKQIRLGKVQNLVYYLETRLNIYNKFDNDSYNNGAKNELKAVISYINEVFELEEKTPQ